MSVKYFNKEKNEWVIFPGTIGAPGEDSYQIAVNHGYKGTYEEYQHMIAIMPDVLMKATDFVNNIDEIPTENSDHLVKSGGVYSSIKNVETLVNDKSSELNSKIEEAKSEIENNINPKLDELNDRITDVESDLNGSLDDLEKIVIDNKNDSDNSISDLEKSFDDKMQEVLDNLNNKANVSDIPTDYVTPDVIEGVYSAIDNIDTTVSAEEVATVLDADMIAGVVNGSLKIEGTAITDGAIATRHMIANTISGTVITGGTIIGDKIAANTLTSNHIKGSALNGLTIEDGTGKWKLNKDGSGYLASQNIKWDTSGNVTFGSGVTIAWSVDQQKQVNNAQSTANTANSTANNAKTTADSANTTAKSANSAAAEATRIANEASSTANTANTKAVNALNVVNSLNNGEKLAELLNGITDGTKKIKGTAIANGAIASGLIAANAIVSGKIATGAITADKIAAGAITAEKIDATDLHVKAANIDGKLTASQIDASNLTVNLANVTGTLSASKITGDISGLTIQSGTAWILNRDGSGHVSNGNLSWDVNGNLSGIGTFTGITYNGNILATESNGVNTSGNRWTYELYHQVGVFSASESMYTFEDGYAIPKYITFKIDTKDGIVRNDSHTGAIYDITFTNIIKISDYIKYSGSNMKLNPYEFKIINIGNAPLNIYKGNAQIGIIPTNSYTNIFMYTDENDTVQCYFQS